MTSASFAPCMRLQVRVGEGKSGGTGGKAHPVVLEQLVQDDLGVLGAAHKVGVEVRGVARLDVVQVDEAVAIFVEFL